MRPVIQRRSRREIAAVAGLLGNPQDLLRVAAAAVGGRGAVGVEQAGAAGETGQRGAGKRRRTVAAMG